MLEDFLKDIYDNALVLEFFKEVSYYSKIRQLYRCEELWIQAGDSLNKLIKDIKNFDENLSSELFNNILNAKNHFKDHTALSSIIDIDIIPKIMRFLDLSTGIDVNDGCWTLTSSKTGFLTLKDKKGLYLHSYFHIF